MEAVLQSRGLLFLPTNPRNRLLHSSQALKHRFFTPKPRASWLQLTPVTAVPGAETSSDNNGVASNSGGRSFPQTVSLSLRSPLFVLGDGGAVFHRWRHYPFCSLTPSLSPFLHTISNVCGSSSNKIRNLKMRLVRLWKVPSVVDKKYKASLERACLHRQ
ncbi:hypothetical protein PIB30_040194 [Stylosanthes scabra]|uniref:Uncharacterized protein n=1 Tax=Stylosanthes scabra TaxID=79078 RepID=A0ABU6QF98_9FABA|nr:hypothetical protein [Stylosanthes scabra]